MNDFLNSYIETALWSSMDDAGIPLDNAEYADAELAEETLARFEADCIKFESAALVIMAKHSRTDEIYPLAHDFWLTRNRHGAGFWDGDYPEPLGKLLTDLAHSFGECDLCVDDGKIYVL